MKYRNLIVAGLLIGNVVMADNINVTPRWQLFGATDGISANVFDGKCVDFVWTFENNGWKVHVANGNHYSIPTNIGNLDFINRGAGFWIKGNSYCQVSLNNNSGDDGQGYTYEMLNGRTVYSINENNVSDVAVITYGTDGNHTRYLSHGWEQNNAISQNYTITDGIITVENFLTIKRLEKNQNYWRIEVENSDTGKNGYRRVYFNKNEALNFVKERTPHEEIELEMDMPGGETYDSLQASSTSLDLTKTYYEGRYETFDGLEIKSHRFDTSAGLMINQKLKDGEWINENNDTFTVSNNEFTITESEFNNQFKVKYLGTVGKTEGNELLEGEGFSDSDVGYKFAYKSITDQYWFGNVNNFQYKDYNDHTQYSSLEEFIDDTKGKKWWQCSNDNNCSNKGVTFSADSNYDDGSGKLVVISNDGNSSTVVNNDAGTWEIKTISGKTIMVVDITTSEYKHDDNPAFMYDGTGVRRGDYEKAGDEGIFFLLDENAKDSFVNYINSHFATN